MPWELPPKLRSLINSLNRLPGIGPRAAERIALHLIGVGKDGSANLSQAILEATEKIRLCDSCFALTEDERCSICPDPSRDRTKLCVVENPLDILPVERSGQFNGLYFVLGGAITPTKGINPESLRFSGLDAKIRSGVTELIIATNPTIEGEATAIYIHSLYQKSSIRITRIAKGIPMGGSITYVDELTLANAIKNRYQM